jgi:hypothetical protein
VDRPPELPESKLGWMKDIWRMTDEAFFRYAGMDAFVYVPRGLACPVV